MYFTSYTKLIYDGNSAFCENGRDITEFTAKIR